MPTKEISQEMDKNYQEIIQAVKGILSNLPDGTKFDLRSVAKNNGQQLSALVISEPGMSIAPTIYLDHFVDAINVGQMSVQEAADQVADMYQANAMQKEFDVKSIMKSENLFCEVVNKDMNKGLLDSVPHEEIADVAVIVRCRVSDEASFVVKNQAVGEFGMTPSELLEAAKRNTMQKGLDVRSMGEVLTEMMGPLAAEIPMEETPMYVITNNQKIFGATIPFISQDARKQIYDMIGGDFYLIPSSIHECLAIPVGDSKPEDIKAIIGNVNDTQVKAEEVLGTQPYIVDKSLKLKLACEQPKLTQLLEQSVKQGRGMHM